MSEMKDEYSRLVSDMVSTCGAARNGSYPSSHSDMESCMYHLLKMFEVSRRPVALEWADMRKKPFNPDKPNENRE